VVGQEVMRHFCAVGLSKISIDFICVSYFIILFCKCSQKSDAAVIIAICYTPVVVVNCIYKANIVCSSKQHNWLYDLAYHPVLLVIKSANRNTA